MSERAQRNSAVTAIVALAPLALLLASVGLYSHVSARSFRDTRSQLKARLLSPRADEFTKALSSLVDQNDQGTLELWEAALSNSDPQLKARAWSKYQSLQLRLVRNELVPQIVHIAVRAETVLRLAGEDRLQLSIWSSAGDETVAAAPPKLIQRLRSAGISADVIYDSIAEWQEARARGDALARTITPDPQASAKSQSQVRIAVVDLGDNTLVSTRSGWLGDRENVLMSRGSLIAYLDVFSSDGSSESINSHIKDQYLSRGFKLVGLYEPNEFAAVAPQLFPGKAFEGGSRSIAAAGTVRQTLAEGGYHSYEETRNEFNSLADSHPDLARYVKLGTSFEGREIFALKITRNAGLDDSSKPDALITGCHHAREWISVESPVYFANQLLSRYETDDQVKYLVDHLQIWIVPIVNPDGLTYSQGSPNGSFDQVRLWRKNRRTLTFGGCLSSVGVDLNRNYGYQWRVPTDEACADYCSPVRDCMRDDTGGSDDPQNETYRGPAAESEPEVKAIKNLMDDPNRHFRAQLDYHNYSQLILYPWGYQALETPDVSTLSMLAQRMSDDMRLIANRTYRPEQSIDLYATTGSSTDYAYGTNRVPAAFTVEMRPDCCGFTVPESDIVIVNKENWAGALGVLKWAAGPPILESVKAYSLEPGGGFSKLVYSARWTQPADAVTGARQLIVDTRFPGLEPGPLQLHLQFSKPMSDSTPLKATLGRDAHLDELTLAPAIAGEGWQKSVYQNDTWIGQTAIAQDNNLTSAWRLLVSASDAAGFNLDGRPESVAGYATGTGRWQNYEDQNNNGSEGGADVEHVLSPTVRADLFNIFVAKPAGGERLAAGDTYTAAWTIPKNSGFVPVREDVSLSTDGGATFGEIAGAIPGGVEKIGITLPAVATTRARIRVLALEGTLGNILFGDSPSDFTIGANVGAAADISFVSSEKVSMNWSDPSSEDLPNGSSGSLRLIVNLKLTNTGPTTILNPFLRVVDLNRGNVLLTRDPSSRATTGALQTIDAGSDNALAPDESVQVRLVIGLVKKKKFVLSVILFGVPLSGSIDPSAPVTVWSGKPKSK